MGSIGIGFYSADLEAVCALLERELGIVFELRDSYYKGEYCAYPPAKERFKERQASSEYLELRKNIDFVDLPEQHNLQWPGIPDCKVVLLIEHSVRESHFQDLSNKLHAQLLTANDLR